ncbi:hypothetical protein G8A07_24230 [Roseateles sp. DAIF2]|uniref:hypothetical protein n=1 Tax=Roseateles sp. DAIF2 TaxID=2714952 RepID=UPI0018A2ED94|nr:hypothetical protein [Roseateles sp. DAIF2]QPF75715.1 hypothetical protein G8A07_24230 [Roseateles sp. DAIF2]
MKSAYWLLAPLLLSACGTSPTPKDTAPQTVASAKAVCFEDTPTGTRFKQLKCMTAEQDQARKKAGQDAADELGKIRPTIMPEGR